MPATLRKDKRGEPISSRAKVTSKGQVTLPSALRKRLGVAAGDSVLFKSKGDDVVVVPQRRGGVFEEFRGIGTPGVGRGKKAVLDWVREVRGEL
jgi:AbrB family looped-hinge helix DNA binding protein